MAHRLHEKHSVSPRRLLQDFPLSQVGNRRFFHNHVFSRLQGRLRLLEMQAVGAGHIDAVCQVGVHQLLQIMAAGGSSHLLCELPRPLLRSGVGDTVFHPLAVFHRRQKLFHNLSRSDGADSYAHPVSHLDYFTSRDFPVISLGCSIPISSMRVGAISARQPPSLSFQDGSAFTRIKGTWLVVWAVQGSPVS